MRVAIAGVTAAMLLALPATAGASHTRAWRVTVTNLTPAGSQPFTPPVLVAHSKAARVWQRGRLASRGLALLAEDGDTSRLESELRRRRGIGRVLVGDDAIPPRGRRSYVVRARRGFDRLSIATMLVNTNDGFMGIDSLRLPRRSRSVGAYAYDAGSERNSETRETVPGPCCDSHFARDPERRRIRRHPGIRGVGDIDPAVYGWRGRAARITIRRIR